MSDVVVVLQARTSSSRLPAKALLPLGGYPLAVLAAKRAASSGHEVIVATSDTSDDDTLAALLAENQLRYFRGSLDDVLGRFVNALAGYPDSTIVVRLTADNPFPDGPLVDEVVADFRSRSLDYLACNGEPSGLPYGLSAEVTILGHLRTAERETRLPGDREHVTAWVARQYGTTYFDRYAALGMGAFRCTVDSYDDYVSMQEVFAGIPDPVAISALDLVSRLEGKRYQPNSAIPVPDLVLGGAQLGLGGYGIANEAGPLSARTASAIIKSAVANGVRYLDTAHAYGCSEEVIGTALQEGWAGRVQVVTKLSPLSDLAIDAGETCVRAAVDASIHESRVRLRRTSLDVVLLHRVEHIHKWNGGAWAQLSRLKARGVIRRLGVSAQNPEELVQALAYPDIEFIQMPFNMLDWRWDALIPEVLRAKGERNLVVHARSVLLQGLLQSRDQGAWARAHVADSTPVVDWIRRQAESFGRQGVVDLCVNFVRAQPWIDGVVLGMERESQLYDNLEHFRAAPLTRSQLESIRATRPQLPPETLDPSKWRSASR